MSGVLGHFATAPLLFVAVESVQTIVDAKRQNENRQKVRELASTDYLESKFVSKNYSPADRALHPQEAETERRGDDRNIRESPQTDPEQDEDRYSHSGHQNHRFL